jgi:uncharacterized membrane protein YdbT with pleckstrin-like domain
MSIERLYRQQPGERTQIALRPHPITFLSTICFFLVAAIAPPIAAWILLDGSFPEFQNPLATVASVLGAGTYYVCLWMFLFTQFVTHYLDVNVVTDKRIVHIIQVGLFSRKVSELDLGRVQDVTSEVHGIIATMLNYGNVIVQTAGEHERFIFEKVPNPHGARERILELSHRDRQTEAKEIIGETLRGTKT